MPPQKKRLAFPKTAVLLILRTKNVLPFVWFFLKEKVFSQKNPDQENWVRKCRTSLSVAMHHDAENDSPGSVAETDKASLRQSKFWRSNNLALIPIFCLHQCFIRPLKPGMQSFSTLHYSQKSIMVALTKKGFHVFNLGQGGRATKALVSLPLITHLLNLP